MSKHKSSKRKKSSEDASVLGIVWYRPEQWELLRQISVDRDALEETYEEWESYTKKFLRKMRKAGVRPIKVDIDVEELLQWFHAHNRAVDGSARSLYTTEKLRKQ